MCKYHHSKQHCCWVRFTRKRCLFILWQSHPGWLQKLTEHLKCDQWYGDTLRFGIAEAGCFPAVYFRWKDGVTGKTWWHQMHVSLEYEGATRNLNGEDKFGFPKSWHDSEMIPIYSPILFQECNLKLQRFRIATWAQAAPKHQFGDRCWSNAFNQPAGVRSNAPKFWLGGWWGWWFLQAQVEIQSGSFLIWPKLGRFVLTICWCTSTICHGPKLVST